MLRSTLPTLLGRRLVVTAMVVGAGLLVPWLTGCSVLTDFGRFRGPAADAGPDARPEAAADAPAEGAPPLPADASTSN